MLKITRTVPPQTEPISLMLAKQHLRVDFPDDDALIQSYISAARDYVETWTGRALMPQTWVLALNAFPFGQMNNQVFARRRFAEDFYVNKAMAIALPRPPLIGVTSITYVDGTGTQQTLPAENYAVDPLREPGLVVPANGMYWPYPAAFLPDTIQITYQAGYAEAANLPPLLLQALLVLVAQFYQNRSPLLDNAKPNAVLAVESLLAKHAVWIHEFEEVY